MLAGGAGLVVPPRDVDTLRQAVHRLVVDSALGTNWLRPRTIALPHSTRWRP